MTPWTGQERSLRRQWVRQALCTSSRALPGYWCPHCLLPLQSSHSRASLLCTVPQPGQFTRCVFVAQGQSSSLFLPSRTERCSVFCTQEAPTPSGLGDGSFRAEGAAAFWAKSFRCTKPLLICQSWRDKLLPPCFWWQKNQGIKLSIKWTKLDGKWSITWQGLILLSFSPQILRENVLLSFLRKLCKSYKDFLNRTHVKWA